MILNMDKIQFESRAEIGTIIKALEDWQEDHEKGPGGSDRSEQPNPAFQSRDLQDPPRCQPHNRGGCPRCHGQDRFGKTNWLRTSDEIY